MIDLMNAALERLDQVIGYDRQQAQIEGAEAHRNAFRRALNEAAAQAMMSIQYASEGGKNE